ncbi:MAG: hypothetical protein LBR69_02950 [Endomicrobium sp.]|jgi:hypothetical protein|nr:hypothetical protein [Endomicrobium sp.]
MMKKLSVALCAVFVAGSLSFAAPKDSGTKDADTKSRKERMAEIKKEKADYLNKLGSLADKYNKASGKDKDGVKNEIRDLIAAEADKELVQKKEMLDSQKARIAKYEAQIAEIETDKNGYIDKKVEETLTSKGQEKIKKALERMNKKKDKKAK